MPNPTNFVSDSQENSLLEIIRPLAESIGMDPKDDAWRCRWGSALESMIERGLEDKNFGRILKEFALKTALDVARGIYLGYLKPNGEIIPIQFDIHYKITLLLDKINGIGIPYMGRASMEFWMEVAKKFSETPIPESVFNSIRGEFKLNQEKSVTEAVKKATQAAGEVVSAESNMRKWLKVAEWYAGEPLPQKKIDVVERTYLVNEPKRRNKYLGEAWRAGKSCPASEIREVLHMALILSKYRENVEIPKIGKISREYILERDSFSKGNLENNLLAAWNHSPRKVDKAVTFMVGWGIRAKLLLNPLFNWSSIQGTTLGYSPQILMY